MKDQSDGCYKNLLVVIDPNNEQDLALERALQYADKSGAQITVFMSFFKSGKMAKLSSQEQSSFIEAHTNKVKETVSKLTKITKDVSVIVSWQDSRAVAIKKIVDSNDFDLVVKCPSDVSTFSKLFSTGLDYYLVRGCKLPVWVVKEHVWDQKVEVLTCLDMNDNSKDNVALNHRILAAGDNIAKLINAELHVVDCYYGEIGSMITKYSNKSGFKKVSSIKERHLKKLKSYIDEYGISENAVHLTEGIPDEQIPRTAGKLKAELTIIGNNADSNFLDRAFGDTAKELTDNMPCDILVLKPM